MGKERDKLLWQLGKKPNTMSNQQAYKECMIRRIKENNPPLRMKKILEEIALDMKENSP